MEFRPFRVALAVPFRGLTERRGVLVRGRSATGHDAWGEYSPFPDYDAERSGRWWMAAMEAAAGDWAAPVRDTVNVNSIVPGVIPDQAGALAVLGGCRTAKVKVGGPLSDLRMDCERVAAAAAALGPGGKVRIDANGAWDVETAEVALRELTSAARAAGLEGLEYAEQPCATIEELAALRRRTDVLIAADESIRIPSDPMAVVRADAADLLVLKVAPLGGVRACLELAERAGLPVVVSSAMETSVGLAAGLALARALPELPYACGLGTGALLAQDVVANALVPVDGMLGEYIPEVTA